VDPSFDQKMATGRNGSPAGGQALQPKVGYQSEPGLPWRQANVNNWPVVRLRASAREM